MSRGALLPAPYSDASRRRPLLASLLGRSSLVRQAGVHLALRAPIRETLVDVLAGVHQLVDVHARLDAHGAEHVHHVLGGHVARGTCQGCINRDREGWRGKLDRHREREEHVGLGRRRRLQTCDRCGSSKVCTRRMSPPRIKRQHKKYTRGQQQQVTGHKSQPVPATQPALLHQHASRSRVCAIVRTLGVRAATQAGHGGVDHRDAVLQRHQDVRQRLCIGVIKVEFK